MNQNRKNNGWILCPSKSFPGKFYYFNVINGDAAWSLNEFEIKNLRKDSNLHKLSDRSHDYPEPSSPPRHIELPTFYRSYNSIKPDTQRVSSQRNFGTNTPNQIFGRVTFPKYIHNGNAFNSKFNESKTFPNINNATNIVENKKFDQITQTVDINVPVQACTVPLSLRFTKYKTLSVGTPNYNTRSVEASDTNTTKCHFDIPKLENLPKRSYLKKPKLFNINKEIDQKSTENKHDLRKEVLFQNGSYTCSEQGQYNKKINDGADNLQKNDLRHILLAKRRQSAKFSATHEFKGKKIKIVKDTIRRDYDHNHVLYDENYRPFDRNIQDYNDLDMFHDSSNKENRRDISFLLCDFNTLIEDFDFIEEYARSNSNHRVLLPSCIKVQLDKLCVGDCCGRQKIIIARHIVRKLLGPPSYFASGTELNVNELICQENDIIKCCLIIKNNGMDVIFITNNEAMYKIAVSLNINTIKPKEIRKDRENESKIPLDLNNIQIQIKNIAIDNDNLFLKPSTEFKPFIFGDKSHLSMDDYKKVFNTNNRIGFNVKSANVKISSDIEEIGKKNYDNKKIYENTNIYDSIQSYKDLEINMQRLLIKDNCQKENTKYCAKSLNQMFISHEKRNASENMSFPIQNKQNGGGFFKYNENATDKFGNVIDGENYLNDRLRECRKKSGLMMKRIQDRLEELICCFNQIMEDTFNQVLLRHSISNGNIHSPWALYDILMRVKEIYSSHEGIRTKIDKICEILLRESEINRKLNKSMSTEDLMILLSTGINLIQLFKKLEPDYLELEDADKCFANLLDALEPNKPDADILPTPVLSLSDAGVLNETRSNYVKKPADIVDYLKSHFKEWKDGSNSDTPEIATNLTTNNTNTKVIRTIGKNLGLLKLKSATSVKSTKYDESCHSNLVETTNLVENVKKPSKWTMQTHSKDSNKDVLTPQKKLLNGNNFGMVTQYQFDNGNTQTVDGFNDNDSRKTEVIDTNFNDFSARSASIVFDVKTLKRNLENCMEVSNNVMKNEKNSFNDSGFGNESIQAIGLVKAFLTELSATLKSVHQFIDGFLNDIREDIIQYDKKILLQDKVNRAHLIIVDIINNLKSIVERESNQGTLKEILIKAGMHSCSDKRLTRYRQVVTKCLEHAWLLENALKMVMNIIDGDNTSLSVASFDTDIRYFNIFE